MLKVPGMQTEDRGLAVKRLSELSGQGGSVLRIAHLNKCIARLHQEIETDPDRPVFLQMVRGVNYKFVPHEDSLPLLAESRWLGLRGHMRTESFTRLGIAGRLPPYG